MILKDNPAKESTASLEESGDLREISWTPYGVLLAASIVLGLVTAFLTKLSLVLSGPDVWDDSYMCVRYIDNLLRTSKLAWNPSIGPSYGQTSLLNLLLVLPIRLLNPSNATRTVILCSLISGVAFLALAGCNVFFQSGASKKQRSIVLLIIFILVGQGSGMLAAHFVGGMDTMFVAAYAALLIIVAKKFESTPTRWFAIVVGLLTAVAYLARPDLMIYSLALIAAAIFAKQSRRDGSIALTTMLISLAVILFGCKIYFGSPIPLPFYAKAMHLYGPGVYALHKAFPGQELLNFAGDFRLLLLVVLIGLVFCYRSFTLTDWAVLAATALFILYYRFFVLQIMPYDSRFYFPTLAAIVYLAARSLVLLYQRLSQPQRTFAREFVLPWGGIGCASFYADSFRNQAFFWGMVGIVGLSLLLTFRKQPPVVIGLGAILVIYLALMNNLLNPLDPRLLVLPLPFIAYLGYRTALERGLYRSLACSDVLRFAGGGLLMAILGWNVYKVVEPAGDTVEAWRNPDVADEAHYQKGYTYLWTELDQWSKFPNDLTLAMTDVGLPGILNPRKTIYDYAGLHDTEIAMHGFDPNKFFLEHCPDVFYQPLFFYPEMSRALKNCDFYKKNYEIFPGNTLHPDTMVGISIYRNGKYYPALHAMLIANQQAPKIDPHVLVITDQDRYKTLFDPL